MFLSSSVAGCVRFIRRRGAPLNLLLALLLASLLLTAARAQEPAQPIQEPSPTQTPTPTPTPTPSPTPTPDEAEPVERINADLTSVLLSATDKGRRFVTTLRREDLRVTEDGVQQQLASFEQETDAPLSLVLLVDTSASQERVLKDEQEAASAFIRSVLRPAKDSASVVSFTGITRLEQPLTPDAAPLFAAINSLQVKWTDKSPECFDRDAPDNVRLRCMTGVWDAVVLSVREVLAKTPEQARRAIILLSDGDDTSSRVRLYQAVEYAARHNVAVYPIGIRDKKFPAGEMRKDFLRSLAEQTGGRAFFPKGPEDLPAAFAQIEQELRAQYLLTYVPTNRARDGSYRRLQIDITNPALRKQDIHLSYRQGYYAKTER